MAKIIAPLIVSASAPTVSDDASLGYVVGQEWQNTATNLRYAATSVALGAAAWMLVAVGLNPTFNSITASTSAGLLLKNVGGTTVATIGAGGGTGVTLAGGLNITGALGGVTTLTASSTITGSAITASPASSVAGITATTPTTSSVSRVVLANTGASGREYHISVAGSTFGAPYSGSLYFFDVTASALRGYLDSSGSWILGSDPGGSGLLRVGGSIRCSTLLVNASGSDALLANGLDFNAGYFRAHLDTAYSLCFDTYNGGSNLRAFKVTQTGSADFASDIKIAGSTRLKESGGNTLLCVGSTTNWTSNGSAIWQDGDAHNFRTAAGAAHIAQLDGSTTAGDTRLLLYCVDTGTISRVKTGASGTGPGGSGRALYV